MNKTCARCEKTVYPTEELKCLDKVWHKGCFKCQECGMTLNMRTYKGYGKLPYCEAHVPKAKHTTMAETPELKRIAENTRLQSNVTYHADFEKSKGKFTQVADDPETLRIKANTRIISNVAYHGDLEKKAQMEQKRLINENGEVIDLPTTDNYHPIDNYATELPAPPPQKSYVEPARSTPTNQQYYKQPQNQTPQTQKYDNDYYQYQSQSQPQPQPVQTQQQPNHYNQKQNQYAQNYNQPNHSNSYPNPPLQYQNPPTYPPNYNNAPQTGNQYKMDDYQYQYGHYQQQSYGVGQNQKIGRIQDYDPINDGPRAPPNSQRASATVIYNSTSDGRQKGAHQPVQQQSRSIGRVTDMDPLAEDPPRSPHPHTPLNQRVYIAMYDYEANDSDEVSFREGDLISDVASIDGGWMTGRVMRTGRHGMLPANYVEIQ